MRSALPALLLIGCLPRFGAVDCLSANDCPPGGACIDKTCVLGVDAEPLPDAAGLDGAPTDASPDDARSLDAQPPDQGVDAGPPDAELIGRWQFSPGAERVDSTAHWDPLELHGRAYIADGALVVDGHRTASRGFARAGSWGAGPIDAKTMVAWVALRGLDVADGSVLSLFDARQGAHDGLAWGHNGRRAWSASHTGGRPLIDDFNAAHTEAEVTRQIALSWRPIDDRNAEAVLCRDGVEAGRTVVPRQVWTNGAVDALFGTTTLIPGESPLVIDGTPRIARGALEARIDEVQLYRGALDCGTIGGLAPAPDSPPDPPPAAPALIGQWTFSPGAERVETTGNWADLEIYGDVAFADGKMSGHFGGDPGEGFARAIGWQGGLIRDKTFVIWVAQRSLDPHGAGVALDSTHAADPWFDGLSWYRLADAFYWTFSADARDGDAFRLRAADDRVGVMRQVALSYTASFNDRARLTLCLDGERIGSADDLLMADWRDDAELLIGVRTTFAHPLGPWEIDGEPQRAEGSLDAEFDEVRLYRGALSCDEVRNLELVP